MLIYKVEWVPNVPASGPTGVTSIMFDVQRGEEAAKVWSAALRAATAHQIIGGATGELRLSFVCDSTAIHTEGK